MVSDEMLGYSVALIIGLLLIFLFIRYAVRANKMIDRQNAIITLLERIAQKQGVTKAEIETIRTANGLD